MAEARPDFDELARRFIYEEVATDGGPEDRLQWIPLMNCFDAWCDYHGVTLDQNRSVRSHRLATAFEDVGMKRTGKKARFRVLGAKLYVGTPDEFLADIRENAEADGILMTCNV